MDEVIISNGDSPLISQPSPVLVGGEPSVVVQENFVGGQNSTIEIGSVETLPAGSQAYVNNVGTPTHAILDFGIVTGNTGESGSDGTDGIDGQAATIQVGTVTTGLPDTNAVVTNVGTENAAILDFTIPRGSQGEQGIQGVAGVDGISPRAYVEAITGGGRLVVEDSETTTTVDIMDGTDGTDGVDGFSPIATVTPTAAGATISITDAQGTTTANITNGTDGTDGTDGFSPIATVTPTASGATISITDSQGTTTANITNGIDGTDGTDGTSATVTVGSTTTGNAGTNASVTNSGTSSAAILDFVIPRGSDGTDGTDGVDGYSPTATVSQSGGTTTITITDKNGTTSESINVPTQFSDLSGTVSTNQIANDAVTSAKIGWSSIPVVTAFAENKTVAASGSYENIMSATIPEAGTYLLIFNTDCVSASQLYIRLANGTSNIANTLRANAYVGRQDMTTIGFGTFAANSVIYAQGYNTSASTIYRGVLTLIRIG